MADANWVLDIAANLPDGAATIAELDALTESLTGAGRKSDEFQAAMKLVTSQLDAAKVAATSTNAALAEGQDHYQQLERDALRAGKALERASLQGPELEAGAAKAAAAADEYRAMLQALGVASEEQTQKMTELDRSAARAAKAVERNAATQPKLAAETARANEALKAYESTLKGLEGNSADATAEQKKFEKQLDNVNKVAKHVDERNTRAAQKYAKLAEASALLPGPLGRYVGMAARAGKANEELTATFGATGARALWLAAGLAITAFAVAAVTAVVFAGAAAWSFYAASTASAARDAALTRDAFAALSPETGAAVASFEAVAAATGQSETELTNLTKQLRSAKVAAADMPAALRAAATAEAALGSGGAAEFIRQLESGEKSVDSFAKEVDAKFGGVVAEKLRGLDAQVKRFSKLWAGLFTGVNLGPVLDAVDILVGMFDKGNPLAQAFALGIEKAFGVVADNAVDCAYAIEAFALSVAISALKAYLFFKTNGDKIEAALLSLGIALGIAGVAWAVFNAGIIAGWIASAATAVVSAATIAAAWLVAAAPAIVFIAAIAAVGYAIYQLITHWDEVVAGIKLIWSDMTSWLGARATEMADGIKLIWTDLTSWLGDQATAMFDIGKNLLMGLVEGVTGAVGAVVSAVTGAVGSAIDAAKDVLGIHSPSTVFAEIGDNTAQGYVQGVEGGTPEAQGSMARMVSPTDAAATSTAGGTQAGAEAASSATSRGASFDFQGATFNFHGVANAETARDRFAEMLTTLLEGDADSLSGATA
jgi:predicted  nucleic acid-binding Zn-ribbon protein